MNQMPECSTRQDEIFHHLELLADEFAKAKIKFFVAEGTLLGAVREKDIISHETRDFEFDILSDSVEEVLALATSLNTGGYEIIQREPGRFSYDVGYRFDNLGADRQPVGGAGMIVYHNGKYIADISVFTVFNDGMARRYDLESEAAVNPRMTIPAWFYEGESTVKIRDKLFPAPMAPELVVEKIYGPDWRISKTKGEFPKGYHQRSGQIYRANNLPLILRAIESDWSTDYSERPKWPRKIEYVGSHVGRKWLVENDVVQNIIESRIFTDQEVSAARYMLSSTPSVAVKLLLASISTSHLGILLSGSGKGKNAVVKMAKQHAIEKKELAEYIAVFQSELDAIRQENRIFRERRSVVFAVKIADTIRTMFGGRGT